MGQTFTVENFKGVREISLTPTGSLVVIAGANGAGKSSFIDAFVELFDPKGTRLTPMPIRDGEDAARAEFIDTDLGVRIVRTWKANDAGRLEVFALDGAKYSKPTEVVAQLTGGLIFDPVAFLSLDERRQRDALLAKVELPFDLDELNAEKTAAAQRRLNAGRDVKRLQGALASLPKPPADAPAEEVSGAAVLAEIQAAQEDNRERAELVRAAESYASDAVRLREQIAELQDELENVLEHAAATRGALAGLPAPVDLGPLHAKLAAVDETNAGVRAAKAWQAASADLITAEGEHRAAQDQLDVLEAKKRAGLAAASFPVEGLSIDDDGVTFAGVPFGQVNSAMRRQVAFAIATAGDPKLRLVIVKDGDLLDADSLAAIQAIADDRGYTVLVERDRDESRRIGFTIVDGALTEAVA